MPESVSICLPVLNEIDVIEDVLQEWLALCKKLPKGSLVSVEDGGSNDGTVEVLKKLQKKYLWLKVVYREKPDGFGNAAKRLLDNTNTEWIFFTDSDGQYVPEDFWILWKKRSDFDVVRGIKMGRQDPFLRRVTSLVWNKSVSFLFNLPLIDINAAFILARTDVVKQVLPLVTRLKTLVTSELIIRIILANYEVKNTYIRHRKRVGGKSRGVPTLRLPKIAFLQFIGLFKIKSDYRVSEIANGK